MKLYVQVYIKTDELGMDCLLTPEEADNLNQRLAANGASFRWVPFATREGEWAA